MGTSDSKINSNGIFNNIYKISKFSFELLKNHNYMKQINLNGLPNYIKKNDEIYINKQKKYCICKITCGNIFGTGFFCKIEDYENINGYISVLITSNQILGKKEITYGNVIFLSVDNSSFSYKIIIDDSRFTYIDEENNITIIELNNEDGLDNICGLEIDSEFYKSELIEQYRKKTIYLIYYSDSEFSENSFGVIQSISLDNHLIKIKCKIKKGALGCPILNLQNFKVIGIQLDNQNNKNIKGMLIKGLIQNFNKIYENKKKGFILKSIEEKENEVQKEIIEENDKCVFFINLHSHLEVGIPCSGNSIFEDVENQFYKKCPEYCNKNIIFYKNGKKIEKHKTVDENNCGDGLPVMLKIEEN